MIEQDPLSALLDDLRDKALAMPEGPYGIAKEPVYDDCSRWVGMSHVPSANSESLDHAAHAAYFAALDRETVLALVAYVDAITSDDGTLATYEVTSAAYETLAALATKRVR